MQNKIVEKVPGTIVLKNAILSEGASAVGIASATADPKIEAEILRAASSGHLAEMNWLSGSAKRRSDPSMLLNNARSVICSAWEYGSHPFTEYVARFAMQKDYHIAIAEKLLRAWEKVGEGHNAIVCIDTKRIAEKVFSAHAGLGWIGKNSLLINKDIGSFFNIGVIITDMELPPDEPAENLCGDCHACIDACPTGAIVEPQTIDCRKCISYLTIEHKGQLSTEQKEMTGTHVHGCDICQEACPFNKFI